MPTPVVLVLGGTGFLGTAMIRAALIRGMTVVTLLRGRPQESEFVRTRLYERVHVLGGSTHDTNRLRQIIDTHDINTVIQTAAGETLDQTHTMTRSVLTAVARTDSRPAVVVPIRAKDRRPIYHGDSRLRTRFIELPDLFGPGDLRLNRFAPQVFAAAAMKLPLPFPSIGYSYLPVSTATEYLLDAATVATSVDGLWLTPAPLASATELLSAVQGEKGLRLASEPTLLSMAVKDTLSWYRDNIDRLAGRMPADGRRIAA